MDYEIDYMDSVLYITRLEDGKSIALTQPEVKEVVNELLRRRRYAAVIEPAKTNEKLAWLDPDERIHHLFRSKTWYGVAEKIYESFDSPPEWLADAADAVHTREAVEEILQRLYPGATVECGEYNGRLNPEYLPSMGDPSAWGENDWLGAASYISFCTWCDLMGYVPEYDLPEDMDPEVREYLFPS